MLAANVLRLMLLYGHKVYVLTEETSCNGSVNTACLRNFNVTDFEKGGDRETKAGVSGRWGGCHRHWININVQVQDCLG